MPLLISINFSYQSLERPLTVLWNDCRRSVVTGRGLFYVPSLQWIIRIEPINCREWQVILLISMTVVIVVELDKWGRRRKTSLFDNMISHNLKR